MLKCTTVMVYPLHEFLDTHGSPFSSIRVSFISNIDCCEQYPFPHSICQNQVNAFLCPMVYDYWTSIPDSVPLDHFHMILSALTRSSLLLHKFAPRFSHGLTFGSILIFQVALYIYRTSAITNFYLLCQYWYTLENIRKSSTSPLLLLTK